MSKRTEIATLGEFGLIRHLTEKIELKNESTVKGVGDDAAVLDYKEKQVLVTTDLLLEGIHFDLTYVPLKHLGYKSAVVNFSDIYAMNGKPKQITVSLGISKRFSVEELEEFYSGLQLACDIYGVDIVGGDTSASLTGLCISITCIGEGEKEKIVTRSGAKDTDLVCVSGDLGAAYMGLQLLEREKRIFKGEKEFTPDFTGKEYLLERQLKPEARKDIIELLDKAVLSYLHDGHFGRPFFRITSYIKAKQCRLPYLRRPHSYRLPDSGYGRAVQHEFIDGSLEWRRRL